MAMRIEVKTVTPEMAELWLTKNKRNRRLNQRRVKMYAREIAKGRWYLHHQGVAFYDDGTLADGQHRLAAIVESGVSCDMVVSWGVPPESGIMIDGHQQRATHQSIRISGLADWIGKGEVSIARQMLLISTGSMATIARTHTEIVDYCNQHKQAITFAERSFPTTKKNITTALTKGAVACAWYYEDQDRLHQFCRILLSGMPMAESDKAAILVREWLLSEGTRATQGSNRSGSAKRIMRAIKAFCEMSPIHKLYEPQQVIYTPPKNEDAGRSED